MASILTNSSAMTALKVLNQTNKALEQTQARISTGLKVGNSKDNASFWAVSTIMKSDVSTFKAISDNLSLANNATSVARDGAQQITKLIDEIKTKTTAAQEGSLDKKKMQADIDAALGQIGEIVKTAQFNGVNLLGSDENVRLLSSVGRSGSGVDASYINFNSQNLSLEAGGGLAGLSGISVLDRGEGLFEKSTDGKIVHTFANLNVLDGSAANKGDVGDIVQVKYKDAKGINRTVDIKLTQDFGDYSSATGSGYDMVEILKSNKELAAAFDFDANNNSLLVSSKNRENGVEIQSISVGNGSVFGVNVAGGEGDATKVAQSIDFNFKDAPLRLGESFKFEFGAEGSGAARNFELSFTVVGGDTPSGRVLKSSGAGTAADPYKLELALDAREVAYQHVTGSQIAAQFEKALDDFIGSASAATVEAAFIDVLANTGTAATKVIDYSTSDNTLSFKSAGNPGAASTANLNKVTVPQTDYQALLDTIESAMQTAVDAAAAFGSAQKRVDIQQDFLKTLVNNLETGIGTLVDADMNEESARLQALQVQQQLGIQALSIANQAPQSLLSLFR